jgi:hypothetical protein
VYEYACGFIQRNRKLEMAISAAIIYDRAFIWIEHLGVSPIVLILIIYGGRSVSPVLIATFVRFLTGRRPGKHYK